MSETSETQHPSAEELHDFVSGLVASSRAEELERHINSCRLCSDFVETHFSFPGGESRIGWTDQGQLRVDQPTVLVASTANGQNDVQAASHDSLAVTPDGVSAGQRFNDYQLNRVIGEGGNGIVYHATQLRPVRRSVAIKFARWAATSSDSPHRFSLEQQTLADLHHPFIPQIFDAGVTSNGVPYFVMKYIDGEPLSSYLRNHRLPIEDCLSLMRLLCECVQHAHRNGVIHRDLKPSNILLEREPKTGRPSIERPHLIDFGIAKNFVGEQQEITRTNELVGTLTYMSPEQLDAVPRCDTRSDVYSLGLILYELLTYRLPFPNAALQQLPLDTAIRRVRCDDPPMPSKAVLSSSQPASDKQIDQSTEQRHRQLRGDLDWIVMKAIDRDADRRYQSAALLADDLDNYVRGDWVSAGPPSLRRMTGKWIRNHRGWFAAGVFSTIILLMAAGVILGMLKATIRNNQELAFRLYIEQIQHARERLDRGGTDAAIAILERQRDDPILNAFRGLEWELLWNRTHPDALLHKTKAFQGPVDDLAVSSRSLIATLSRQDQTLKFFSIQGTKLRFLRQLHSKALQEASREITTHWEKHAGPFDRRRAKWMSWWQDRQPLVSCIEFTPDGSSLAIGTCSGFALLWNIDEQRMTRFIDCGSDLIYRIEISDDGRWLATLGTATRLTDLYDDRSSSGPSLLYETEQTRRADFSPDSRHLVIADTAENLLCWETENRSLLFAESVSDGKTLDLTINDVQFSPDGQQVITAMGNSKLYRRQWGKKGLGDAQLIGSTLGSANAIRFAGETTLASVCELGVLQSWNLRHIGRPAAMSRLAGHSGGAGCLAHAPSANSFVTGGQDGYVRMYQDKPRPQSIVPKFPVTCISVSSTGERFAMGYSNGLVELRSTESAEVVGTWRHKTGSVAGIIFAKNQSDLIVAFSDHKIGIWDIPSDRQTFVEVHSRVYRLTGNLPGDEFAITFWDGTMGTFSSSGQSLATWTINPNEVAVATMLRLHGRIVTCEKGLIRYWDQRGRPIHQTLIDPEIQSLAPHPSGETLIGFGGNGRIFAIDADSGAIVKQYRGHIGAVTRVTLPVDGRRLLSIGTDSTARVWDYESGLEMLTLDVSPKKYRRVAMSRDSGVIVAVLSDHSVEIIRLDQD